MSNSERERAVKAWEKIQRDKLKGLPVRHEVTELEYHRQPTNAEIKLGYGAIHYRTFPIEECCHEGTRIPKKWFKSEDDGLRYYR